MAGNNPNVDRSGSEVVVRFAECLHNHAARIGGFGLDGCREFTPGGENGTLAALHCSACLCHRNFHRRVEIEVPQPMRRRLRIRVINTTNQVAAVPLSTAPLQTIQWHNVQASPSTSIGTVREESEGGDHEAGKVDKDKEP